MDEPLLIVGLGASAGGIKAIRQFFERVPADSGIAYVVILHLSPDHDSHLAEVLQVAAAIPVTQVSERVKVQANNVYVIAPNQSLSIHDGHLQLAPITSFEERRAPVDIFFRTLAEAHRSRSVAVILSGTGANGSMGLKRIKEHGGICLAQRPEDAEFTDMPLNAIATGMVDEVLPAAEMPAKIIGYGNTLRALRLPEETLDPPPTDEQALRDIFSLLRSGTGHDFSNYKRATMLRRFARRMGMHTIDNLPGYAAYLREHGEETRSLLRDLLIGVTNFFRDKPAFDALESKVIPALFARKTEGNQVRVWVAGCATGEEAYSVAMLLAEHAGNFPGTPGLQVFATDIDEAALAAARDGVYTLNDAANVSPERLRRFFTKEGELYRVRRELREVVLFAHHNLIKDPPFSHLDLACCRNLLIYLNRTAQQRVMDLMQFALNPEGFLFLGSSESADGATDLFSSFDKDARIFRSRAVTPRFGLSAAELAASPRALLRPVALPAVEQDTRDRLSLLDVHRRLLEQYAPPSVVVNEEYDIVHLTERAGQYLQYGGGEPSHNLLKAVRPELRIELRTALYQALQQQTTVEARDLAVNLGDRTVRVHLRVRPVLRDDDAARGFFLVIFEEAEAGSEPMEPAAAVRPGDAARQLEDELMRVRTQLRSTVERHETQAEELKASNEELHAMNEELRSSAEELETSKEELQSLNEELRTVNQELKTKVDEQIQANDDIQNLINAAEIGTIFLDRSLRIKLFTPKARDIFNLIAADRGRPLSDINTMLLGTNLPSDLGRVLEHLERIEREVRTRNGRWYLMRAVPYRTADERIDGVAVTFVDITDRKRNEDELLTVKEKLAADLRSLTLLDARMRHVVDSVTDYAIFTLDPEGRINTWNPGASAMFGFADADVLGQPSSILFTPEERAAQAPEEELRLARETGRATGDRWRPRKDGSRFFANGILAGLFDERRELIGYAKITRDLTEGRNREEQLRRAQGDLEIRVEERTDALTSANRALDLEVRERREGEDRIRGLMGRLITVQEDERRRIARDLHDHLGQQVAGLRLKLEALGSSKGPKVHQGTVSEALTIIERLDRDLDFVTWELRPAALDDLGLVAALRAYVGGWSKNFGIRAEFHGGHLDGIRLAYEVEMSLYRITQEALNNVYKHAAANHAGVLLERRDSQVVLIIEDDGKGFDLRAASEAGAHERGIGLLGMRERAALAGGTMDIETTPGEGTTVFVQVPVPKAGRAGLTETEGRLPN